MTPLKKISRFLKSSATQNTGLKLVALIITLGLFLAVRSQEEVVRGVDVEVDVILPSEETGVVLTSKPVDSVRVYIKGRSSLVNSIKNGEMRLVKMDLSDKISPGTSTFFFDSEMFNFKGVEVVDITPESASIRVEKLVSRSLPIRVKTSGRLMKGTQFEKEPIVEPPDVIATGPSSAIRSINYLETDDVGIEAISVGPYNETVPLVPMEGLRFRRDNFRVYFNIIPTPGKRVLPGLPVVSNDKSSRVEILATEVSVTLLGPQLELEQLDPTKIVPMVVVEGEQLLVPGVYEVKVTVTGLPNSIRVESITPALVSAKVKPVTIKAEAKQPQ